MPTTYVGLLRGINVGKAKRVAMADLRTLLEELGFESPRTLLNSGNIVFTSNKRDPLAAIRDQVEAAFTTKFGFSSRLTLLSAEELVEIVEGDPFGDVGTEPSRYFVAFLSEATDLKKLEPLTQREWKPEALALGRRVAYLWCPEGLLESALPEVVGKALKDGVTTRNWATVLKLHALAREHQ